MKRRGAVSRHYEERHGLEDCGSYADEPDAVPIDPEGEQRELEAAGWERLDRMGKIVWRSPSGYLYPQGAAIARLRRERREEGQHES